MDTKLLTSTQATYIERINRVLDHINSSIEQELPLKELASVANFSTFHFHRVFKSIVGEPLNQYVQRVRLEKAAAQLTNDIDRPVLDVAMSCGFNSQAAFARSFKDYFGVSATAWRHGEYVKFSKNRKQQSNISESKRKAWKNIVMSPMYIDASNQEPSWRATMQHLKPVNIAVKTLPETHVAYIRHIGKFKGETKIWASLFQRLIQWASARDLLHCPGTNFFTIFRDDLNLTDFSKFQADVCISLDKVVKSEGEIGVSTIKAGKYAVATFEIDSEEFEQAWDLVFRDWLPQSGFQPDDGFCFERYLNDANQHPQGKHAIEVCIPVKPL